MHYRIFYLQGGSPFSTRESVEQGAKPHGAEEKESLLDRSYALLPTITKRYSFLLSPDETTAIGWKMIHRHSILIDDSSGWPTKNLAKNLYARCFQKSRRILSLTSKSLPDWCVQTNNNTYFKHNNFLIAAASASIYHKTFSWIVEIGDPCKYVKIPYKMHMAIVMTTITFLNDYLSYSGW